MEWVKIISSVSTLIVGIATILVLWFQLRKLSDQVASQLFSDYTKRYQEIILHFPEDINEPRFLLNKEREDYRQTMRYMRAYFDLCFEEWYLYAIRKKIDKKTWDLWKSGMESALSKAAFQQAWNIIKQDTQYGSDFNGFIEKLLPIVNQQTD